MSIAGGEPRSVSRAVDEFSRDRRDASGGRGRIDLRALPGRGESHRLHPSHEKTQRGPSVPQRPPAKRPCALDAPPREDCRAAAESWHCRSNRWRRCPAPTTRRASAAPRSGDHLVAFGCPRKTRIFRFSRRFHAALWPLASTKPLQPADADLAADKLILSGKGIDRAGATATRRSFLRTVSLDR